MDITHHPLDLDNLVSNFEKAWQSGTAPRLDSFLPPPGTAWRKSALEELVKIDLEYHWRRVPRGSKGPLLDEYIQRFSDLGSPHDVSPDLIAEEYWARCMWGDRPSAGEYLRRFPKQAGRLREQLARVDEQVAREMASLAVVARSTPVAATIACDQPSPHGAILKTLGALAILSSAQLKETAATAYPDPRSFVRSLLERGWLTALQANLVLQGRDAELLVGPYLLLERIGQGGAGDVYKARHQHMERIVAVKLIKKELATDPEVLARFLREVKVASQLVHPNVVHAYDAGPCGGSYFLAMEYVDGIDLSRLVKAKGPLPVAQACNYVRQVAVGLQHIHERGLVHRDIKPSNLLLANPQGLEGLVKILDLGLARLRRPAVSEGAGALTGPDVMLMGTLDYMAPEQAVDFRSADIRADIYSLGCTLYYLLTGQPPFLGGTLPEKLLRHQMAEPTPVERSRADVPAELSRSLSQMMAKKPEDRFQTPQEIVDALTPGRPYLPVPINVDSRQLVSVGGLQAKTGPYPVTVISVSGGSEVRLGLLQHSRSVLKRAGAALRKPQRRRAVLVVAALAVLLAILVVLPWGNSGTRTDYLADLQETAVGPGTFTKDGTARLSPTDVRRLSVDGKLVSKGLFMVPPTNGTSYVRYRLGKRYKTLSVQAALSDASIGSPSPLTFTILGDQAVLWESKPPLKMKKERRDCPVLNVAGVEVLELAVTCPGANLGVDYQWGAYAAWVDPVVSR